MGIGLVARGDDGRMIAACAYTVPGSFASKVAEAIGVREALLWIKDVGWPRVHVESDAAVVITSIQSVNPVDSSSLAILLLIVDIWPLFLLMFLFSSCIDLRIVQSIC